MTTTKTTIKEKEVMATEVKAKETQAKETKFSKEEMDHISGIKQQYDTITVQMGQYAVEEMQIKLTKESLEEQYKGLRKQEQDFATKLSEKYGQGSLNLDTGVFISNE